MRMVINFISKEVTRAEEEIVLQIFLLVKQSKLVVLYLIPKELIQSLNTVMWLAKATQTPLVRLTLSGLG